MGIRSGSILLAGILMLSGVPDISDLFDIPGLLFLVSAAYDIFHSSRRSVHDYNDGVVRNYRFSVSIAILPDQNGAGLRFSIHF